MEQKLPKQVKISIVSLLALLVLSLTALGLTVFQKDFHIGNSTDQTPKQTELYRNQGVSDLQNKDYSSATNNFQKAIEGEPKNAQNYIDKSVAEYAAGDKEAAMQTINEGLKQDPDNELLKTKKDVLGNNALPDSNLDNVRE